jgi:histidinol-phosphate phosphatase family protein
MENGAHMSHTSVVFLDRDGTINEEVEYLSDPRDFRLLPGAAEAVRSFNEAGWHVVLVTNQSGIGRGYFTWETLNSIHQRMTDELAAAGARVDGIYICPHRPDEECDCRKPKTGMFEQAMRDLGKPPGPCAVIGDNITDLEPGQELGCTTVLVETGYGAEHVANRAAWAFVPDAVLPDLRAAAEWLLSRE